MQPVERNGVRLFFEAAHGDGARVVLVHGWCCDHTYFVPQFEHFAKAGRTVVALDLSGTAPFHRKIYDRARALAWGETATYAELARQAGLTLIGRAKGKRFIALSGEARIQFDGDPRQVEEEGARVRRKASVEDDAA